MSREGAAALLAVAALLLGGCERGEAPQPNASPTKSPFSHAVAGAHAPAVFGDDAVVADVDLATIRVADVKARLRGGSDDDALAAIGAAVLDSLALRELAVLDLRPEPGEAPSAAVDRLLALAFAAKGFAKADPEVLRLRFLERVGRFRHPRALTVWEAFAACCADDDCPAAERTACLRRGAERAPSLAAALRAGVAALDPPATLTPGVAAPLATTPCKKAAIPDFERVVASFAAATEAPAFALRRYTFYARGDTRFPERAFRRADPALEAAASSAPALGAIFGPVETETGWSVGAVMAQEPAQWRSLDDADVQRELGAEICAEAADAERDAWLERLGKSAHVAWRRDVIAAVFGQSVAERLPSWRPARPMHVPDMAPDER